MEAYKFETTVLKDGMIKVPQFDKFVNQEIEIFIVLKSANIKNTETSEQITFKQWNKQFNDDKNLDDFIPEYGTTLREFRKGIFEAETGQEMTMKEFKDSIKTW